MAEKSEYDACEYVSQQSYGSGDGDEGFSQVFYIVHTWPMDKQQRMGYYHLDNTSI